MLSGSHRRMRMGGESSLIAPALRCAAIGTTTFSHRNLITARSCKHDFLEASGYTCRQKNHCSRTIKQPWVTVCLSPFMIPTYTAERQIKTDKAHFDIGFPSAKLITSMYNPNATLYQKPSHSHSRRPEATCCVCMCVCGCEVKESGIQIM